MSYLVLARKWRPQTFDEVVGQKHVTQTLRNSLMEGRLSHAYLFTGPRGVGKTSVARILAKALNCLNPKGPDPCNKCRSCREITAGVSVDVLEIDGASNTHVDDVRELRENVKYLPASGKYKVFIIDEVHMLSKQAFNALLKTLEEPPAHVVFIFATTEPHKIPATVISRCQRYDFRKLSVADISGQLERIAQKEGITISQSGLFLLAREADGSMRDAEGLLDQVVAYAGKEINDRHIAEVTGALDQRVILDLATAIIKQDTKKSLETLWEAHYKGFDLWRLYNDLVMTIRNLLVIKTCGKDAMLVEISEPEKAELTSLATAISVEGLYQLLQMLVSSESELRFASQPLLALEMIVMRCSSADRVSTLSQIMEKLESVISGEYVAGGKEESSPSADIKASPVNTPLHAGKKDLVSDFIKFAIKSNYDKSIINMLVNNCRVKEFDGGTLIIEADPSVLNILSETKRKKKLENLASDFFGEKVAVKLVSRPGLNSSSAGHFEESGGNIEQAVRKHPLVKKIGESLKGEITEIKTS